MLGLVGEEARLCLELRQRAMAGKVLWRRQHRIVVFGAGKHLAARGLGQRDRTLSIRQVIQVEAGTLAHRADDAPTEAQQSDDTVIGLAGHDPGRQRHAGLPDRQSDAIAVADADAPGLRRCDQQRIVPCQLGQRTGQFLQPGIVVEAAVP